MSDPLSPEPPIMAVFSGADLDRAIFDRALQLARSHGAALLLADVRHQRRADQLAESLSSESFLGRGAADQLARAVKEQRTETIRRGLEALAAEAASAGVAARCIEAKGELNEAIQQLIAEHRPATVVVPRMHRDAAGGKVVVELV